MSLDFNVEQMSAFSKRAAFAVARSALRSNKYIGGFVSNPITWTVGKIQKATGFTVPVAMAIGAVTIGSLFAIYRLTSAQISSPGKQGLIEAKEKMVDDFKWLAGKIVESLLASISGKALNKIDTASMDDEVTATTDQIVKKASDKAVDIAISIPKSATKEKSKENAEQSKVSPLKKNGSSNSVKPEKPVPSKDKKLNNEHTPIQSAVGPGSIDKQAVADTNPPNDEASSNISKIAKDAISTLGSSFLRLHKGFDTFLDDPVDWVVGNAKKIFNTTLPQTILMIMGVITVGGITYRLVENQIEHSGREGLEEAVEEIKEDAVNAVSKMVDISLDVLPDQSLDKIDAETLVAPMQKFLGEISSDVGDKINEKVENVADHAIRKISGNASDAESTEQTETPEEKREEVSERLKSLVNTENVERAAIGIVKAAANSSETIVDIVTKPVAWAVAGVASFTGLSTALSGAAVAGAAVATWALWRVLEEQYNDPSLYGLKKAFVRMHNDAKWVVGKLADAIVDLVDGTSLDKIGSSMLKKTLVSVGNDIVQEIGEQTLKTGVSSAVKSSQSLIGSLNKNADIGNKVDSKRKSLNEVSTALSLATP